MISCDVVANSPSVTYFKKELNDNEHNIDNTMDVLDLSDASTVVNVSLLKNEKNKNIVRKCKQEPDSLLDNSSSSSEIPAPQVELHTPDKTDQSVDHVVKVVGWLERSLFEAHEKSDSVEATESIVTDDWLDENSSNPSLRKNTRRVRVFLVEVEPSPDNEPLDLVSGYCYDGCKRFSMYSTVVWSRQDSYDIPLCHNCSKTDSEKELRLMFKFKLRVIDSNGIHADLNVWKEHGEEFFGCSTEDFIRNYSVRAAAVTPLRQYTVANTMDEDYTPLLDLNLVCVKDFFFVINSKLKQMNESRRRQDVADFQDQHK